MRVAAAAVALVSALAAMPAAAMPGGPVPWDADGLRGVCGNSDRYFVYGACGGYLSAVHDLILVQRGAMAPVCLPEEGALMFDHLEALAGAVSELPPIEGESAAELAVRAFERAFPCE